MPAAIAAALICTYAPRHPVEPQPRRIASRNVIQAPPRGHKRLRDHIGRIICVVRAPQHISDHAPLILRVELLEPSTTSIKRSSHVMGLASLAHTLQDVHHTDRISARTPPSTKSAASPTAKPADGDPPSHAEAKSALPDPALTSHQRRATAHFGPEIALGVSTPFFQAFRRRPRSGRRRLVPRNRWPTLSRWGAGDQSPDSVRNGQWLVGEAGSEQSR